MRLLNADGSPSEISGNGVRCLATWIAALRGVTPGSSVDIATDAGPKRLELLSESRRRYVSVPRWGNPNM